MNVGAWIKAFRLRTLPLALASIGMGAFLSASDGIFRWSIFLLCASTTILLQILSNLANDYGDSVHGADHAERSGPSRMVQTGQISLAQIRTAMWLFVGLCLVSGISLLYMAFGWDLSGFLFFLGIGILSIGAAVAYTAGRKPYGYMGLGDISVLIFFGLVGVLGSYYLFAQQIRPTLVFPALSCGLFATGVLNVNNIRDIESDKVAGKYSIPVRIGRSSAVKYHWFLLLGGMLASVAFTMIEMNGPWQWLFLLSFPLFIRNGLAVQNNEESVALDPYLKQLALSTLFFVLTFGIGLLL